MQKILLLMLGIASCASTIGPKTLDPIIVAEWKSGQEELVEAGWPKHRVQIFVPQLFKFKKFDDTFECGPVVANGCFQPPKTIMYNAQTPHAIRHEAGHAILYRMGVWCWRDWKHEAGCVRP